MLAFRERLAFLAPRLSVLQVCERGRGASPFLDGSRTWMARFPDGGERLVRKGLPDSFERWGREALLPRLFGPRMRLRLHWEAGLLPAR